MKKFFAVLFCAALMAAPAAAMTKEEEDAAWKKEPAYGRVINIGYNGGLCNGALGIAKVRGFYEAEGLEVKIVRLIPSGTAQTDALGVGKVDVTENHIATFLVPTVNGVRIKFTSGVHSGCQSLYVLASSDIKKTADLIGKQVAVTDGIGGAAHNIAMRFFNHDKIDPRQIKWKVAEGGVAVMALQSGEISAALLSDQFAKKFLDAGTLRIIRSLTFDEDFKQEPCCIHAVNLDFYNENPVTVKKLTRAHKAVREWMTANPDEAVRVLQEHHWAAGDYSFVCEIFKTYDYTITDEATETALRNIIDDYKTFGMIDSAKDTEELLKRVWDPVLRHE